MRRALEGSAPVGPYSPGIIAEGRFVWVSGQGPLRDGEIVSGSIEEETARTLENIAAVLASAGASLEDVVRCGVYLADLGDFERMNSVYERFFSEPRPARTTIGAALMGIKVEIECVAALPPAAV